jgi:alginate O-acetyltransferase complex protein AlgI
MFQSATYWLVLAAAVACYWFLPPGRRPAFLTLVSVGYLASLDLIGVAPLIGWTFVFWYLRHRIAACGSLSRWLVTGLVVSVIAQLAYFKYLPPMAALFQDGPIRALAIPLGISFITFKLIHFALETQRGTLPHHGFWDFMSWTTLFSIWTAGPIERLDHFIANRAETPTREVFAEGLTRIVHGLVKKFVLGLQLVTLFLGDAASGEELLAKLHDLSTLEVWRFLIVSFLLLYLDFSAYSDIAIGSTRLFGIRIMENFNWPILASNPAIYWKRWHMTLSGWCQSYVYMPVLAMTRNPYCAVFAAFICIGAWHAGTWNWIAWGLYHATAVASFQAWTRFRRKRRWDFFDYPHLRYAGIVPTVLYTSAAGAFTTIQGVGVPYDGLRILAKLILIDLPA